MGGQGVGEKFAASLRRVRGKEYCGSGGGEGGLLGKNIK